MGTSESQPSENRDLVIDRGFTSRLQNAEEEGLRDLSVLPAGSRGAWGPVQLPGSIRLSRVESQASRTAHDPSNRALLRVALFVYPSWYCFLLESVLRLRAQCDGC